jgi:Domain of unknown function (DUF4123)
MVSPTRLEMQLWPKGYRRDVWMVVDSARDRQIFGMLLESHLEHVCLYSGVIPAALEAVAPYLVQLEHEDRRCRRFLEQAWGNSWGIFLKCDTTRDRLRRHLRGFLKVRDQAGNLLLFRYYDPRVLRTYLPSCSNDELRTFFGPIQRFTAEGETGKTTLEFGFDGSKLVQRELSLDHPPGNDTLFAAGMTQPGTVRPQRPGMLVIRREQLALFSAAEVRKFEDWMVVHLNKFFRRECSQMGEAELRETIQYGIRRAASYGLKAKRDVCKYIDVMMALGRDFDTDERLTRVTRVLTQRTSPNARAQNLLQAAVTHLRQGS